MAFPSVYEMTNPLTTVRKQHFWEYFSGSTIISNGVEWQNMTDGQSASGNVLSKSGNNWQANAHGTRTFSSSEGAELEYTVSANASDSFCGFDISTDTNSYNMDYALYAGAGGTIHIYTGGAEISQTGVTYTTADRLGVRMDSSGTVTFLKNGAVFYTSSTTASGTYRVSAVIYTSGVSITANMNSRWTTNDITHTGTFAMVDEADEGFSILSSTSGARSAIGFNNLARQYAPRASVAIFDLKRMTDASHDSYAGFKFDDTNSTFLNTAVVSQASYATNIGLYTGDGSTATNLEGTTPRDTAWHNYKIENGTDDIKLSIDGVVDVTKTTNRPETSTKLQPFVLNSTNTSASKETRIKYMECYNT